jgi:ring-1,2-phenylacetyl-CoA epoxidase subunit PaaE
MESRVRIVLDDETSEIIIKDRESTILEAALEAGIDVPYSCQSGVCVTCKARITEGTAEMENNYALTDEEIERGFILTCQAQPTSEILCVDYDDVF